MDKHHTEADTGSSSVLRLQSVLETRLWRLMQKRLYDPSAARALKPLSSSSDIEPTRNRGSLGPSAAPLDEHGPLDRINGNLDAQELAEDTPTIADDQPAETRTLMSRISLALGAARSRTLVSDAPVQVPESNMSIQDARPPSGASSPASVASTASESDWWPFDADEEGLSKFSYGAYADSPGWWSDEELFEPSYLADQAPEVPLLLSHENDLDHVQTYTSSQAHQPLTSEPEVSQKRPHPASNEETQSPPWHEMARIIDAASPAASSSGLSTPPPPPLSSFSSPLTSFSGLHTPSPPHRDDVSTPSTSFSRLSTPSPPHHSAVTTVSCCSGLSTPLHLPSSDAPLSTPRFPKNSSGLSTPLPIPISFSSPPTTRITSPLSSGLHTPLRLPSTDRQGGDGTGPQAAAEDAQSWSELTSQEEAIPSAKSGHDATPRDSTSLRLPAGHRSPGSSGPDSELMDIDDTAEGDHTDSCGEWDSDFS